ncbi:MHS family MFS transporter [Nocardia yamanashiensis]|uniref:MFS transporter n=1 Tax=Nocardia yamanashiensis TaxID=209247 RepID=UPI001E37D31F|nr:MFS transporter [Nocardia yamanashiensis]UGT41525.1 MHS family MFS transporter [Nocardia yamanashiensis]
MHSQPSDGATPTNPQAARKAAVASFVGTAIEWYDFFLYGAAAALIFAPQYFPSSNPAVSQLGSFASFAVGFLSRPLGGVVAGHFGDRFGRKRVLIISLLIMGGSTVLVGLLPTYDQIGMAAPVLLVALRLLQGVAVGAEWGGASLMAIEHAPPKRRVFYGAATQLGVPAGAVLAYSVMLMLSTWAGDSFTSWGWRVAFVSSIVLVIYGLYARRQLSESPMFEQQAAEHDTARLPILEVLRVYPKSVLIAIFATASSPALGYIVLTYILSYGTKEIGYSRNSLLIVVIVASAVQFVATLVTATLADRWSRRKLMLIGSVFQVGAALAFFPIFDTGIVLAALIGCSVALIANTTQYAPLPAVISELFPTRVRYSGASIGYQFGAILGGSLSPIIATAILAGTGSSLLIGVYLAGMTVLSAIAVLIAHSPAFAARTARAAEPELTAH